MQNNGECRWTAMTDYDIILSGSNLKSTFLVCLRKSRPVCQRLQDCSRKRKKKWTKCSGKSALFRKEMAFLGINCSFSGKMPFFGKKCSFWKTVPFFKRLHTVYTCISSFVCLSYFQQGAVYKKHPLLRGEGGGHQKRDIFGHDFGRGVITFGRPFLQNFIKKTGRN